jgi:FSR family fosmidomycin resistance protein-like MFS transporter
MLNITDNKKHTPSNITKTGIFTLAHLANDIYPNLYPVLLPMLMLQLHFSIAAAALISTVSSLTSQLLQPVMGYYADKIGGRRFIVGGLILGSVFGAIALGLAPTYSILLITLLIGGLGNAAFHPHASALVSEITGKRKGFGMSLFMIGGNFGRALAPIMASTAFMLGGRRGLLLVAIPGLIMALIMSTIVPKISSHENNKKLITSELKNGLGKASKLLIVVGLRSLTTLSTLTLVPILWKQWGHPLSETAGLLSLLFIAGSFGNILGGTISDYVGPKPVLVASALFSSIFLILFLHTNNIILAYIFIAFLGASLYSTSSVIMVFTQALFPDNKGMASGLTLGIGNTLGSLGVVVIGLIADHSTPILALYVTAAALILSIPFVYKLKTLN